MFTLQQLLHHHQTVYLYQTLAQHLVTYTLQVNVHIMYACVRRRDCHRWIRVHTSCFCVAVWRREHGQDARACQALKILTVMRSLYNASKRSDLDSINYFMGRINLLHVHQCCHSTLHCHRRACSISTMHSNMPSFDKRWELLTPGIRLKGGNTDKG